MKHLTLLITLLSLSLSTYAQKNPKWFNKARQLQLTLYAYDAQGIMRDAQAFYTDNSGRILTEYDILKGAVRANAIDASSKEHDVLRVLGASSLYNVARLTTAPEKKMPEPLPTVGDILSVGDPVVIMPRCSNDKKALCHFDTIAAVQQFTDDGHPYYTLKHSYEDRLSGTMVLTVDGRIVGSLQHSAQGADQPAYVLGISYPLTLANRAFDAKSADLTAIGIQPALPEKDTDANAFLYLLDHSSEIYHLAVQDYITNFPNLPNGYIELAEWYADKQDYAQAEATYTNAFTQHLERMDEAHYSFAKQLYKLCLQQQITQEGWTFDRALSEISEAYTINPLPIYTAFQGTCLYAMARYEEAYNKFLEVTKTNMRSSEMFLYAAQCKQMLKAPLEEVLAMQDSALNCYSKPYPREAANIIYLRAKTMENMERYREAVVEMNEYEHIMAGRVSAQFYYEREQMEMQCRMYPAAISDIDRACKLAPQEPLYRLEMAVVHFRVGELPEAIEACRKAIKMDDEFADAHRILGICLREQGKTDEARTSLQRAAELGDKSAEDLLKTLQ